MPVSIPAPAGVFPAWAEIARQELGVKEVPGPANNPRVLSYYAAAGHPEIKHESVAWCSALACAAIEWSGHVSPRDLSARSFLRWGKKLVKPEAGAVVVLTRGDPASWTGHVGFVWAWDETHIWVLGGNQGDAVSVARFPLSQVLGYRVPVTAENSRTVAAAKVSAGSGVVTVATQAAESALPAIDRMAEAADAGQAFASTLSGLAHVLPVLGVVAGLVSVVSACVILWARLDDLLHKGR